MRLLFLFLFSGISGLQLLAQPEITHPYCHHAATPLLVHEPSPEELLMMENSNKRSDSIDVLNYSIDIDVTDFRNRKITAHTAVEFRTKMDSIQWIILDLRNLTIDSVIYKGRKILFSYDNERIQAYFEEFLPLGQKSTVEVFYRGTPGRDPVWGGFYFADPYIYNLGIGLSSTPPNFGKVWYPCFDNFVERATYDFIVTSVSPARAYCVGTFITEDSLDQQKIRRHFQMTDPIPTYLSSIAVSDYVTTSYEHRGSYLPVPVQLVARQAELELMKTQFVNLPGAIDAFEFWYGPYRFERVGYVATTVGAMEHPTNTAYPVSSLVSGTLAQNERLMAHEFGHQWWGNLTTLDDARDMWIKEGTAEYSSHLFFEYVYGKERFIDVVRENLSFILFNAHVNDSAFLPLSPMPYSKTYGTHTYRKGAAMIHNLRAYLGDSMYRKACHLVFDSLSGSSMNAYQFRDFLNRNSGKDLSNYFNDHIFNRGYCSFYIDSSEWLPSSPGKHILKLRIIQKDYYADHLFTEAPIVISLYAPNFKRFSRTVELTGESNWVSLELPSEYNPTMFLLNEFQEMNLASLQDNTFLTKTGSAPLAGTGMTPSVSNITDSAYLNIVHHLVGPTVESKLSNILRISDRHFWQVSALAKGTLSMAGRVDYLGQKGGLDEGLNIQSEDSVLLVYRKDWTEPWREYQPYIRQKLTPSDKRGFLRIDHMVPGEYAIGYGSSSLVATDQASRPVVSVYPNPASSWICIDLPESIEACEIEIKDLNGSSLQHTFLTSGQHTQHVDLSGMNCGFYEICIKSEHSQSSVCELIEIVH